MNKQLAVLIPFLTQLILLIDAEGAYCRELVALPPFTESKSLVQGAKNREPHFYFPEQVNEAKNKLEELNRRTGKRPNILIIVADDMGWGDPGVYGGGPAVGADTPHIDTLAMQGLKLTSTYSQPTCSPTRGTIMTGRLPVRHGVLRPPQIGESVKGLANETTLPEMLSDAGYYTAMVGKWHLGEELKQQPQYNGFDEYYGIFGSIKNYTAWRDEKLYPTLVRQDRVVRLVENNNDFVKSLVRAKRNQKFEEVYELNIDAIAGLDLDLMKQSVNFIERMQDSKKPWLLYHAMGKPHFDSYPSKQFAGASASKGVYQDAIVEVDYIVGQIVAALQRTGQSENTLVFFTSDNGPSEDSWPDTGHTPFRGAKGSTWEGGVRVPGIAWWPGMVKGGRTSDGLFDLADLFATAATLANAQVPGEVYIDGIDQTSFLLAENGYSNRPVIYYYVQNYFTAYRVGPFKASRYIVRQTNPDTISGFINDSFLQKVATARVVNLYTDAKERMPRLTETGVIKNYMDGYKQRHLGSMKEYPPAVTPL